jgi:DNA-binding XRE family transcriptional regulator
MSRHPLSFTTLVARVRAWFGLRQDELARYLGVSPGMVAHLEAGRRTHSAEVLAALLPLVQQLPPEAELLAALAPAPDAPAPAAPDAPTPATPPPALAPGIPPPEAAALDLRRRECLLHAARLRAQAGALTQQATVAARWAAALPALLAAVPGLAPPPAAETAAAPPAGPGPAFDRAAWLRGWLARRAQPLPAEAATRYHLLLARAAAHAAEAAALAATLATA